MVHARTSFFWLTFPPSSPCLFLLPHTTPTFLITATPWVPGIVLMRQEVDGPPQGKLIGDPFRLDWNSKKSRMVKRRCWALPRPHISYVETAQTTHVQKGLLRGQKGSYAKGCSLSICFFSETHLGQEICKHTWKEIARYQIWTVNQANQSDWPKETRKKCPIKVIHTAKRVPPSDSLSLSESACVSVHMDCTIFSSYSTLY